MRKQLIAAAAATLLLLPQAGALAQPRYEDCAAVPEGEFRNAIAAGTLRQFQAALPEADADAIIARHWRQQEMDALITRLGRQAREEVAAEAGYVRRLISNYHPGTAEELTRAFSQRLYESAEFRARFEQLTAAVATDLAARVAAAGAAAEDGARRCVRAYIGARYTASIGEAVLVAVRPAIGTPNAPVVDTSVTTTLNTARALSGATILVLRGSLERIVERIVARSAGAVAGALARRLVPVLGTALFAWDLVFGADGVLADVEEQLAGEDSRATMREGMAAALKEATARQTQQAASDAADAISQQWDSFRRQHEKVLALAETDPQFRDFVANLPADRIAPLAQLVDMLLREGSEASVKVALANGSLARAVRLPDAGIRIALDRRSIPEALAWADLAGAQLPQVAQLGIHQAARAEEFSRETLGRLLALELPAAVAPVLRTDRATREVLLAQLPTATLRELAARLPAVQGVGEPPLATLARYLESLPEAAQQEALLQALQRKPELILRLAEPGMRQRIAVESRDPAAALRFLVRETPLWDLQGLVNDARLAAEGVVSPWLLWQKHQAVGGVLAAALVVLFFLALRLLSPLLSFLRLLLPKPR